MLLPSQWWCWVQWIDHNDIVGSVWMQTMGYINATHTRTPLIVTAHQITFLNPDQTTIWCPPTPSDYTSSILVKHSLYQTTKCPEILLWKTSPSSLRKDMNFWPFHGKDYRNCFGISSVFKYFEKVYNPGFTNILHY